MCSRRIAGGGWRRRRAVVHGAVNLNQIKVTYSDGTVVAVNAGTEDFRLDNARHFMIK